MINFPNTIANSWSAAQSNLKAHSLTRTVQSCHFCFACTLTRNHWIFLPVENIFNFQEIFEGKINLFHFFHKAVKMDFFAR